MIRNALGIFIGVLATSLTWTVDVSAATWVDTDKISNSRNLQIQIDTDSIHYKNNWIYLSNRIKDLGKMKTYNAWELGVNCSKSVLVELAPGADQSTQFRRNGKWFKDFVNRNNPSDFISVEIKADDDAYREKTYALVCKKYSRK